MRVVGKRQVGIADGERLPLKGRTGEKIRMNGAGEMSRKEFTYEFTELEEVLKKSMAKVRKGCLKNDKRGKEISRRERRKKVSLNDEETNKRSGWSNIETLTGRFRNQGKAVGALLD